MPVLVVRAASTETRKGCWIPQTWNYTWLEQRKHRCWEPSLDLWKAISMSSELSYMLCIPLPGFPRAVSYRFIHLMKTRELT